MATTKQNDLLEKAKVLGNIGLFIMSMIFGLVSYIWMKNSSDIDELKGDIKQLLRNDASKDYRIDNLDKRVDRVELRVDKLTEEI